jgi:DNA-binding NarL/FixJ family response regulator
MLVDMKRTYMELRPDLARVYAASQPGSALEAAMRALGFGDPLPRPVDAGTEVSALDFGPGSVDGWLARHVDAETTPEPSGSAEPSGEEALPLARLSNREREVLAALADGLSNRELAERLFISERTANRHLSNIFTKLGVNNRTSAARIAIVGGLTG